MPIFLKTWHVSLGQQTAKVKGKNSFDYSRIRSTLENKFTFYLSSSSQADHTMNKLTAGCEHLLTGLFWQRMSSAASIWCWWWWWRGTGIICWCWYCRCMYNLYIYMQHLNIHKTEASKIMNSLYSNWISHFHETMASSCDQQYHQQKIFQYT